MPLSKAAKRCVPHELCQTRCSQRRTLCMCAWAPPWYYPKASSTPIRCVSDVTTPAMVIDGLTARPTYLLRGPGDNTPAHLTRRASALLTHPRRGGGGGADPSVAGHRYHDLSRANISETMAQKVNSSDWLRRPGRPLYPENKQKKESTPRPSGASISKPKLI